MDKPPRNPVWSRDELNLALDVDVKTGGNPTTNDDAALDAVPTVWMRRSA